METGRESLLRANSSLLLRFLRTVDVVRLRIWESQDISLPQLRILFRARAHPDTDVRSLAAAFGISNSAVSQQVDRLVSRGLLSRTDDPEDRRRVCLRLTENGEQAVGDISRATRAQLEEALTALTDEELTELERLLSRVAGHRQQIKS
jgi:DNA-binding MarR family transcriptional regulator